jgi:hypothetical protein
VIEAANRMHQPVHEAVGVAVASMGESRAAQADENGGERRNARNAEIH